VEHNIIAKSGSWFAYHDDRIGQGRDAVKKYLHDNEKVLKQIDHDVRVKLGLIEDDTKQKSSKAETVTEKPEQSKKSAGKPT